VEKKKKKKVSAAKKTKQFEHAPLPHAPRVVVEKVPELGIREALLLRLGKEPSAIAVANGGVRTARRGHVDHEPMLGPDERREPIMRPCRRAALDPLGAFCLEQGFILLLIFIVFGILVMQCWWLQR
jgi:hypothetical protein